MNIATGQLWRNTDPRKAILVRVLEVQAGNHGPVRIRVQDAATKTRTRWILGREFHAHPLTEDGRPRRGGYVLDTSKGEPDE